MRSRCVLAPSPTCSSWSVPRESTTTHSRPQPSPTLLPSSALQPSNSMSVHVLCMLLVLRKHLTRTPAVQPGSFFAGDIASRWVAWVRESSADSALCRNADADSVCRASYKIKEVALSCGGDPLCLTFRLLLLPLQACQRWRIPLQRAWTVMDLGARITITLTLTLTLISPGL